LKLKISATSSRLAEEPKSPPVKENLQPLPAAPPQPQQAKAATPSATPEKKPVVQSPSISRLRPRKKEEPKVGLKPFFELYFLVVELSGGGDSLI